MAVNGFDLSGKPGRLSRETVCLPYLAGRMHESFIKTDTRATRPLERIRADTSGIKTKTERGYKYFLLRLYTLLLDLPITN